MHKIVIYSGVLFFSLGGPRIFFSYFVFRVMVDDLLLYLVYLPMCVDWFSFGVVVDQMFCTYVLLFTPGYYLCSLGKPRPPTLQGFCADWVLGGDGWTTFRDAPYANDTIW